MSQILETTSAERSPANGQRLRGFASRLDVQFVHTLLRTHDAQDTYTFPEGGWTAVGGVYKARPLYPGASGTPVPFNLTKTNYQTQISGQASLPTTIALTLTQTLGL